MQIACAGKSSIGIPRSVGCEFHRHDMARSYSQKQTGSKRKKR